MRGSPLLRALLAFGVILLLGLPLARMTRPAAVSAPAPAAPTAEAAREMAIEFTFTTLPTEVAISHLGATVWSAAEVKEAGLTASITIPFPKEGVDLGVRARFPESAPLAAMRVRLTDPDGGEHERTCWGKGEIDEVLTFP